MSNSLYDAERRILVCNDDGIFAPGIRAMAEVAAEFGQVDIIAPAASKVR